MRTIIQTFTWYILSAGLIVWLLGGARRGVYIITEEIPMIEAVTEIQYTERHDKFLPGIDFLFGGVILGGSFYLISFLYPKPIVPKSAI